MHQPCFGKTIIMYKYVSVYILLLMYNSSSMCYLGNTFFFNLKKDIPFYEIIFLQWNGCKFSTHLLI
jgi:hypothetical protein